MKQLILAAILSLVAIAANAQGPIRFVPQWYPQSQFAGFYMALENGFYKDAGLDVAICHKNSQTLGDPVGMLTRGEAEIVEMPLVQAMKAVNGGVRIVNILQIAQQCGLCLVSREPVSRPSDLNGKNIACWKDGFFDLSKLIENEYNLKVNWVHYIKNGANLYVHEVVDASLCYSYNELISLTLSCGTFGKDHILHFPELLNNMPEDGLYVTEEYFETHQAQIAAFVEATVQGWNYAINNKKEAIELTMRYINDVRILSNETEQYMMFDEYVRLMQNPATGAVDFAPVSMETFESLNKKLLDGKELSRSVQYNEIFR